MWMIDHWNKYVVKLINLSVFVSLNIPENIQIFDHRLVNISAVNTLITYIFDIKV